MLTPGVVAAYLVSLAVCWLMIRLGPKDAPDGGRKVQARPVPSAGGLGILAGLAAGLVLMDLTFPSHLDGPLTGLSRTGMAGPMGLMLVASVLGYADDRFNLPAIGKLVVLAGASLLAAIYGPQIGSVWFPGLGEEGLALPVFVSVGCVAVWLFVLCNAVNFMDGANGIAMGSAAIMLSAMALILMPEPGSAAGAVFCVLILSIAAIGGFLVWNLTGRLYAGDTGALAMGALVGGAGAGIAANYSVWVAGIIVLPVLVDVFMTLAWRAKHHRPLMQAHRDHAYQLCVRSGWSHLNVSLLWWGMSLVCGGAAFLAARLNTPSAALIFSGLLLAGIALWVWQRLTLGRALQAQGR